MVGLLFTVTLLSILGAVGFLFAWMVRLASQSMEKDALNKPPQIPREIKDSSCTPKN